MFIKKHVPGFCAGVAPEEAEFTDLAALLVVPFVSRWSTTENFDKFSMAGRNSLQPLLMAEMLDGSFWVVGYLSQGSSVLALSGWSGAG